MAFKVDRQHGAPRFIHLMARLAFKPHFYFGHFHIAHRDAGVAQRLLLRCQLFAIYVEQALEMNLVVEAEAAGVGRRAIAPETEFGMALLGEAGDVRGELRGLAVVARQIGMAARALVVGDAGQSGMAAMLVMAAGAAARRDAIVMARAIVTLCTSAVGYGADGGIVRPQAIPDGKRFGVALAAVLVE
jgi:hypothetical protein